MSKFDSKTGPENAKNNSRKGSPNKFSKSFKDLLTDTIHALENDEDHGLEKFARDNPKDFYRICSKLVPQEMVGEITGEVTIRVVREGADS